ncbi:hypothetical protein Drorol1_Dr00018746 [Drosera rotundifolia]
MSVILVIIPVPQNADDSYKNISSAQRTILSSIPGEILSSQFPHCLPHHNTNQHSSQKRRKKTKNAQIMEKDANVNKNDGGSNENDQESQDIANAEPGQSDPMPITGEQKPDGEKRDVANVDQEGKVDESQDTDDQHEAEPDPDIGLDQLLEETDQFISSIPHHNEDESRPLEIPNLVEKFLKKVDARIDDYDTSESKFGQVPSDDSLFLITVHCLRKLRDSLGGFTSDSSAMLLLNLISSVLHRAMLFIEDELRCLLQQWNQNTKNPGEPSSAKGLKAKQQSFKINPDSDQGALPDQSPETVVEEESFPAYKTDAVANMHLLARAMILAGYEAECFNVFLVTRRHAFSQGLKSKGFEKISIDDVQKMQWEPLEGEIAKWIRIFKRCSDTLLPGERDFYHSVFPDHPSLSRSLLSEMGRTVYLRLVNFAEAVVMTKKSTEKLFKFLDMYEALRDLIPSIDDKMYTKACADELKSEFLNAGSRLGEAAVTIFCELETSIKSDNVKTPVPNGAVHPLTRYTMNYLKYACEYKDTLEQVFQQHRKTEQSQNEYSDAEGEKESQSDSNHDKTAKESPFAAQLMIILNLLDKNLETKSALYKDPSLRYIFLLNNGRYMLQKLRGSTEIHQVVGDPWCRKRSTDMRHYHKNYQRETWSRVLQCLNQEGLQVNGKVHKPVLKERFKNFNQQFDEIHKTQSTWVVSDDQLQSELRVSISAVMIPAYRSFVARFGQYFTPGRQTEKYIKYHPEDIESAINELFDGTTSSMARRKT